MPSSIVLGATGITGREIVKALAADQEKWGKVYALSRSQKDSYPSHVVHRPIDLLTSAEEMAKSLEGVEGEYVFFAAYMEQAEEEKACEVNGKMLSNFLKALDLTNASSKVRRIVLVTGAKQYGVHLGQPKNPMLETDPWLTDSSVWPPNFYYVQQDILKSFCAEPKHNHISWTVTYPNDVIGFAKGNFMNLATSIGIFAAIHRELASSQNEKGFLPFPGSESFYTRFDSFTSAPLHAQFCLWAASSPRAANEAFNVVNGDVQSWQDLWPRVARRFGLQIRPNQFLHAERDEYSGLQKTTTLKTKPPLSILADEIGLRGRVGESKLEQRINLEAWSKLDSVRAAWDRIVQREGIERDGLQKATWAFCDFILGRNYDLVISMSKAREMGWTGYQDTWRSLADVFDELEAEKVLPKTRA
ncbi:hypothetical protein QBC47DRAFT_394459 [Echria macrotheca]|uniref:PRISE-like Rossmann-fold domain-containing protein n=1 Tax=Echria macrotheca TaxID=438768 RepID=A0AAJ0F6M5_9PEZI|nr:hypothetical protein QBC47DRAFT_394459 [Echria macrotheca]